MVISENDHTCDSDSLLRGFTFEDLMFVMENENPANYPEGTAKEDIFSKVFYRMMAEACKNAYTMFKEYQQDMLNILYPPKVIDGTVKTLKGWMDSDTMSFTDYVKPGDAVDYDIVMHFANMLPPKSFQHGFIQVGEPYDTAKEGERYMTFVYSHKNELLGEVWGYKGHCLVGTTNPGTPLSMKGGMSDGSNK